MSILAERELWEAATVGDLSIVKRLVSDPAVNVNWQDPEFSRSPFYRACGHGGLDIVKFLMSDPRVDVMLGNAADATPFFIACQEGFSSFSSFLLLLLLFLLLFLLLLLLFLLKFD